MNPTPENPAAPELPSSAMARRLRVGDSATFTKTVGEYDVYGFAGITGDFAPNHIDRAYMEAGSYGERIAHGVLILGLSSTASTQIAARSGDRAVSYGYDRVRFVAPVFLGDTVTITYTVDRIDDDEQKSYASVVATDQRGQTCMVATHIMKFLPQPDDAS
ncbi:MaoC/PaaZ C-terminal domain-containing protein [Gordonia sp. 'Campus']|uniref:MaoC family dehydratase n=1 Tax=Gordonia sp. 'Campus' TaxID=2915824 RepID=UPI001EE41101|nr:MaoC/PaaZ C-terminal domain-containing protein [Gordonia sp. 'Campus']